MLCFDLFLMANRLILLIGMINPFIRVRGITESYSSTLLNSQRALVVMESEKLCSIF